MPRAGQGMGGSRHSMSSGPHEHSMSSHHVGGGRPGGPGNGFDSGPRPMGGFGHSAPHGPGHFGPGPGGPSHGPHGGYFDRPGMPMPHSGYGCPPPPPPHYGHGSVVGHVMHHLFCQPPAGYCWRDEYMERRHFEEVLRLLRLMDDGYDLSYADKDYIMHVMGKMPYSHDELHMMIDWVERELRYF